MKKKKSNIGLRKYCRGQLKGHFLEKKMEFGLPFSQAKDLSFL